MRLTNLWLRLTSFDVYQAGFYVILNQVTAKEGEADVGQVIFSRNFEEAAAN
jgi:hypothetical protein